MRSLKRMKGGVYDNFCCILYIYVIAMYFLKIHTYRIKLMDSFVHFSANMLQVWFIRYIIHQSVSISFSFSFSKRLKTIPLIMFLLWSRLLLTRKLLSSRPLPVPPSELTRSLSLLFSSFCPFYRRFPGR